MRGLSKQLEDLSARDSKGYDKVTIEYIKQANPYQPTETDLFKNYYSQPISCLDSPDVAANRQYNTQRQKKSLTKIKPTLTKPSGLPTSY